jgi:hypothetical protein
MYQSHRVSEHTSGNVEIFAADLHGAILESLDVSPSVSGTYDHQHRTTIEFLGVVKRFFIGVNLISNDVISCQRENFVHE